MYFDGKLFHYYYMKSKLGSKVLPLCENSVSRVMRAKGEGSRLCPLCDEAVSGLSTLIDQAGTGNPAAGNYNRHPASLVSHSERYLSAL